jgi:signal transduction histidine kinase
MSDLATSAASTWTRISRGALRVFHEYANWLVGISWKRFVVLAVLLMILASILQKLPPFRWEMSEVLEDLPTSARHARTTTTTTQPSPPPAAPAASAAAPAAPATPQTSAAEAKDDDVLISIDKNGVRISPRHGASTASASAGASSPAAAASTGDGGAIEIALPGATREAIREAVRAAREAAREAAQDARQEAEDARREAEDARREAQTAVEEAQRDAAEANAEAERATRQYKRTRIVHFGDSLTDLAFLFIVASAIVKATYKGRLQAEVKAAEATETAESEQLKRQVVEARMAAMQAQVEPHFLFNTLASIDHLIETDPPRASQMQKNLIALLRASMPTMRESHPAAHNLGREMAVIRPYLAILKVRMEDRLMTQIDVPDGLLSADFPSMMIQSLVENAIKHGLEPKPEGGLLSVRAEIVHGKLAVTVADTGMGFGKAATAGTGIGLNNIRERLQLLYGNKASMTVAENAPSGTLVTLTVPYQAQHREGETA